MFLSVCKDMQKQCNLWYLFPIAFGKIPKKIQAIKLNVAFFL